MQFNYPSFRKYMGFCMHFARVLQYMVKNCSKSNLHRSNFWTYYINSNLLQILNGLTQVNEFLYAAMNWQYEEKIFMTFFDQTTFLLILCLKAHRSGHQNFVTYANFEHKSCAAKVRIQRISLQEPFLQVGTTYIPNGLNFG